MEFSDLERDVDRELKRLGAPRAPRTLLPRVLAAAVQLAPGPWYTRAWLAWPVAWQALSVVVLAALVTGVVMVLPHAQAAAAVAASELSLRAPSWWLSLVTHMEVGAAFTRIVWRVLLQPVVVCVLVVVVVVSLGCAVCWMAAARVALGGASQS